MQIYETHAQALTKRKEYESGLSIENVVHIIDETLRAALNEEVNSNNSPLGPAVRNVEVPYLQRMQDQLNGSENKDIDTIQRYSTVRPVENILSRADFCTLLRSLNAGQL